MCPISVHFVAHERGPQGRVSDRRPLVSSMRAVFHRLQAKAADFRVGADSADSRDAQSRQLSL